MSSASDPRERVLTWIEAHFTTANVTDDNGNAATSILMFEEPEYPIELVLLTLYRDYAVTVGDPDLKPLRNADRTVDSYRENVPITVSIIDKADLTAVKVKWKVERELRRIAEVYLFGSIFEVTARHLKTAMLGNEKLHSFTYVLSYLRDTS